MDEARSRKIALQLLKSVSGAEVKSVLDSEISLKDPKNWYPYGGVEKNWDRIGNQTSDPVGALAELVINSIDAILLRKAKEAGINERSSNAPKSMIDAVNQFYPNVLEGKIASLSPRERTALAEESVLIGVKRAKNSQIYPTYTIADFGEGQNADNFPKTLLSLGEKNKEGITFVQGRYNMGSTASLNFCTQGDMLKGYYKLIISKRALKDSDGKWGWTLVRAREARQGESMPVIEYFAPDKKIARFSENGDISAFGHGKIGAVNAGTIVKLYEYDIGPGNRAADFGLNDALTVNLLECALPVRIYDFDTKPQPERGGLRKEGIADRTFSGMKITFSAKEKSSDESKEESSDESNIELPTYLVMESAENASLGIVKIYATGIKELPEHLKKYKYRCFYTVNGQTQAKERRGFFNSAKLGDLLDHLIVQVNCNKLSSTARSNIFKPDRERMNNKEIARELKGLVVAALRDDRELREYAEKIRKRRAEETIQENMDGSDLWDNMIRNNPDIMKLLGMGGNARGNAQTGGGGSKFKGKKFPTFLKLNSSEELNLPVNTCRRIECSTDADNDYFARDLEAGEFLWEAKGGSGEEEMQLRYSQKLRNGKLYITVYPPPDAVIGESVDVVFGVMDSSRAEPLTKKVKVKFVEQEKTQNKKSGGRNQTRSTTERVFNPPNIRSVPKEQWDDYNFHAESGAKCDVNDSGITIYVNEDNKFLLSLLQSEADDANRKLVRHVFIMSVAILTLAVSRKIEKGSEDSESEESSGEDVEEYVQKASSAISAHIVPLIKAFKDAMK